MASENPHQDIHDALGILPTGDDGAQGMTDWHTLMRLVPKFIYDPQNTRGTPYSPQVPVPSTQDLNWRGAPTERGGKGLTELTPLAPQSPVASEMARSRNMLTQGASDVLGLTDAARALRGEMTPEEAKGFALTAAAGLIPGAKAEKAAGMTMSKLFPDATWLGASGLLHPQEYVSKLGGVSEFAKNFPASFEKMKGYLKDPTENAYDAIKEALSVRDDLKPPQKGIYPPPYSEASMLGAGKDISEEAINAKLAKNPGASIFDIAGAGPSSDWNVQYMTAKAHQVANKLMPSDFPREVPFQVPPRAQGLGFTTPAVHGTADRWGWEGPLDQLKLPEGQLGVHFGDPGQAAHFSVPGGDYMGEKSSYQSARPRSYPAVLQVQNPLETSDMGSWGKENMIEALQHINDGTLKSWTGPGRGQVVSPQHAGLFPPHELEGLKDIQDVRDYILSKGFDSIKYTNSVEGAGRPSYIMFQESPTQKGYVTGVRSPFAQFDPSKLHLASTAAGVGGIAAVPLLSRNEGAPEE